MGVLKNQTLYYPEADIFINGKYAHEVSIQDVMNFKKEGIKRHGYLLESIEVTYNKRKDGIIVKFFTNNKRSIGLCLSIEDHESYHRTVIFLKKTKDKPAEKIVVKNSDYGIE